MLDSQNTQWTLESIVAIHKYEQLLAVDNPSPMTALNTFGARENTYDVQ